jgi:phosphoglycolate phosphatase-like HAD superfamily hydrolase
MAALQQVRLIALDCDGVLINDTYLAVIARFVRRHGGSYDKQAEKSIIGLQDVVVAERLAQLCSLDWAIKDILAAFWEERQMYLSEDPIRVADGVETLLASLQEFDVRVVCYGGRTREHTFEPYLGHLARLLDQDVPYVSINEYRPGVRRIVRDIVRFEYGEAIFVDDVSRVAEDAKTHGAGFIGMVGGPAHTRQQEMMAELEVRHILGSFSELTPELFVAVDGELASGTHWKVCN